MTDNSPQPVSDPSGAGLSTTGDGTGDGVQVSGRDAAGGRTGSRTFVILIASLALVVVALFGMFALHAPALSRGGTSGGQSGAGAAARQFHEAPPSPKPGPPGGAANNPGNH